jgi:hypothetical protein
MTSKIDERLVRLLGGAELSDLRARLRRRYELGPSDGKLTSIQVAKLNQTEHIALASLVGRKGGVAASTPSKSPKSIELCPTRESRHPFGPRLNSSTVRSSTGKPN